MACQDNNIRLQELVAALQFLVFALNRFYAVDNSLKAGLQHLCLFDEIPPRVFAELVHLLAVPSGRHGADIVILEVGVDHGRGRVSGNNHGAAAFPAAQLGSRESGA